MARGGYEYTPCGLLLRVVPVLYRFFHLFTATPSLLQPWQQGTIANRHFCVLCARLGLAETANSLLSRQGVIGSRQFMQFVLDLG